MDKNARIEINSAWLIIIRSHQVAWYDVDKVTNSSKNRLLRLFKKCKELNPPKEWVPIHLRYETYLWVPEERDS